MKLFFSLAAMVALLFTFPSCKSESAAKQSFCDSVCVTDSIKFIKEDHKLKPYVYLSAKDCKVDTLTWGYNGSTKSSFDFVSFIGDLTINPAAVGAYIRDTSLAYLYFNDCSNGRGYLAKIPYSKSQNISRINSALTPFDPKFSIDESLIAYSDRGNLFVEEKATGKQAMMTFGERIEIDYNVIHDYIDSVNITPTRIWAKAKIATGWKEFEKKIEFK